MKKKRQKNYRKLVIECVKDNEREGNNKTLAIERGFIERTVTAQRKLSYSERER